MGTLCAAVAHVGARQLQSSTILMSLPPLAPPPATHLGQGRSPKKEVGGRLKQDLDKDLQFINSAVLKLSYTAFRKVTSCNSGLTFARISVQKVGEWGRAPPPVEKSGGRRPPAHYTVVGRLAAWRSG